MPNVQHSLPNDRKTRQRRPPKDDREREYRLTFAFAFALRAPMQLAGPVYRRHDPYTQDDDRRPPSEYKFQVGQDWFIWGHAQPLIRAAKRECRHFRALLESNEMTLTDFNSSHSTLLEIYRQLKPIRPR